LLEQALDQPDQASLRAFAAQHHLPLSTLHYWRRRRKDRQAVTPDDEAALLRDFFESAPGLDLLSRIVLAAHLVFQQTGACGIRPLLTFFRTPALPHTWPAPSALISAWLPSYKAC